MFHIRALRNTYSYVAHQHMYTDKISTVTLSGVTYAVWGIFVLYQYSCKAP